ncbi:TPA: disulfide bond formation protein DsbA [Candidatus Saccharibacteria bacterium]|nr:disulfide bond formation protein DsbA [Candidatus Saccharibacteria bacterium]HRJ90902.1 thioredoxin domain-containing protein [Candidatus Saccharibacteria bacterium]
MSKRAWIIFVAICVIGFGGLVVLSQQGKVDVSNVNVDKIQSAKADNGKIADHVYGKEDSKVVLIEYGDFQCPGCGAVHPRVKDLVEKYKSDITFVFRNYPLTQLHANARAAAAAAEAAGLEGKYWEMHNTLFESQDEWSESSTSERGDLFATYAQQSGVKKADFTSSLENSNDRINKKINFDMALGKKVDVSGTPTFFLNGKQLTEEQVGSDDAFEKAITDALKKAGVTVE